MIKMPADLLRGKCVKIEIQKVKVKGKKGKKNIEFSTGEPSVSNLNVQCRSADARNPR